MTAPSHTVALDVNGRTHASPRVWIRVGDKVLVTTCKWFVAPDGREYRAAFGTVRGILDDEATLGVRTNRNSTNWYAQVGNITIAGCQIYYVIRADEAHVGPALGWSTGGGELREFERPSMIYNADGEGASP